MGRSAATYGERVPMPKFVRARPPLDDERVQEDPRLRVPGMPRPTGSSGPVYRAELDGLVSRRSGQGRLPSEHGARCCTIQPPASTAWWTPGAGATADHRAQRSAIIAARSEPPGHLACDGAGSCRLTMSAAGAVTLDTLARRTGRRHRVAAARSGGSCWPRSALAATRSWATSTDPDSPQKDRVVELYTAPPPAPP